MEVYHHFFNPQPQDNSSPPWFLCSPLWQKPIFLQFPNLPTPEIFLFFSPLPSPTSIHLPFLSQSIHLPITIDFSSSITLSPITAVYPSSFIFTSQNYGINPPLRHHHPILLQIRRHSTRDSVPELPQFQLSSPGVVFIGSLVMSVHSTSKIRDEQSEVKLVGKEMN